jgi:hypothetical protein
VYMLREVGQAERGKAPEIVAAFKTLDQWFERRDTRTAPNGELGHR